MAENKAIERQSPGRNPTTPGEVNDTHSDPKPPQLGLVKYLKDLMGDQSEDQSEDMLFGPLDFFGFASMRKRLSGHAVDFLLNHRRWAKPEDPPEVVAQKNVIIMFTIYTEIEDCLVQIPVGHKVDKAKPLGLLQQLLGISYMKGPRAYTFALAILKAYTNSRYEQILGGLARNRWPREPWMPMDKTLLSLVDRRLVFVFTREPLHTMPVPSPASRLQHHRLKLERLLSNQAEVEKVFTEFVPMVPQVNQKAWPKPWHIKAWLQEQEDFLKMKFNLPQLPDATKSNPSEISHGISMYKRGTRLACNYISTDPAPEVVQTFTNSILTVIEGFAKYLEGYLVTHLPVLVGQHAAIEEVYVGTDLMMEHPAKIHRILQNGVEKFLFGLESENLTLVQWSWVATEVQQGKAAVQNACEESLARRLPQELNTGS